MIISCLLFKQPYYSINKKYHFYAGVKYRIKKIDNKFYHTIKNIKIPRNLENKKYEVLILK